MNQNLRASQPLTPALNAIDYLGAPFTATDVAWTVTRYDDGRLIADVTISNYSTVGREGSQSAFVFAQGGEWPAHMPIPPDWFIDATRDFTAQTAPAKAAA